MKVVYTKKKSFYFLFLPQQISDFALLTPLEKKY